MNEVDEQCRLVRSGGTDVAHANTDASVLTLRSAQVLTLRSAQVSTGTDVAHASQHKSALVSTGPKGEG